MEPWVIRLMFTTLFGYAATSGVWAESALVFQSDFGLEEPAVASMKGVAYGISPDLKMYDNTHEIPVFNIWEAAYRLNQVAQYWPTGTVFVSVVDPGVGTNRKSVVLKTKSGHFFVTPDNGTLTLVAENLGIEALREIDESANRLKGSERSHTFHGRDVYAYTGARLASGTISFEEVGPTLNPEVFSVPYQKADLVDGGIRGGVPILDSHYGNVWTNISADLFDRLNIAVGDTVHVTIKDKTDVLFQQRVSFVSSFGGVALGEPAVYVNDILNIGIATNQGNFAEQFGVEPGPDRVIELRP